MDGRWGVRWGGHVCSFHSQGEKYWLGMGEYSYENLKSLFSYFIFSVRLSLLFVALCPTGPTCTEGRAALGGGTVCVCCGLISYQVTGPLQTL